MGDMCGAPQTNLSCSAARPLLAFAFSWPTLWNKIRGLQVLYKSQHVARNRFHSNATAMELECMACKRESEDCIGKWTVKMLYAAHHRLQCNLSAKGFNERLTIVLLFYGASGIAVEPLSRDKDYRDRNHAQDRL